MIVTLFHPKELGIRTAHSTQTLFRYLVEPSDVAATLKVAFGCIALRSFPFYYAMTKRALGAGRAMFHNTQLLQGGEIVHKKATDINVNLHIYSVYVTTVRSNNRSSYNVWPYCIKKRVCRINWWYEWYCLYLWNKTLLLSGKVKW